MSPVALVTGGQQGIGLGIARSLQQEGFRLALASRSAPDSDKVQAALAELGEGSAYFQHDVRDVEATGQLLDRVETEMGPITTLVANAGVAARVRGDMLDIKPDDFSFVTDINMRGAFFLAQATARRMLETDSAHYRSLIFITSVSAAMASIERAEYCISKAATAMTAQLFALRLAPHGIGAFELRPGITETDMTSGVKDAYTARIEGGLVPARRWGQPADTGSAAAALATGRLAFATGAVIAVDGGLSISRL